MLPSREVQPYCLLCLLGHQDEREQACMHHVGRALRLRQSVWEAVDVMNMHEHASRCLLKWFWHLLCIPEQRRVPPLLVGVSSVPPRVAPPPETDVTWPLPDSCPAREEQADSARHF